MDIVDSSDPHERVPPDNERPGHWDYRVMRREISGEADLLTIHKVHYDADGMVTGWTENPVPVMADTDADHDFNLVTVFKCFQRAFTEPVLSYETAKVVVQPVVGGE